MIGHEIRRFPTSLTICLYTDSSKTMAFTSKEEPFMSRQLLPKAVLSAKDQHFREFALHDNMWKVILYV